MVQAMQQHRGLSSGVLNGNEALKPQRAEKEQTVDKELTAAEALMNPALIKSGAWQALRAEWSRLKSEGMGLPAQENLSLHTRMISTRPGAMVDIADHTALTIDSEMAGYYLTDACRQAHAHDARSARAATRARHRRAREKGIDR
ncbi:MAG: hypothetical protein IPH08_11615 [Rhodocyclaceae bacterium]|nr:hypothetical protein [Rhodocyclaceae bacterium]